MGEGRGGWERGGEYLSDIVSCGAVAAAVMSSSDSSESGRVENELVSFLVTMFRSETVL